MPAIKQPNVTLLHTRDDTSNGGGSKELTNGLSSLGFSYVGLIVLFTNAWSKKLQRYSHTTFCRLPISRRIWKRHDAIVFCLVCWALVFLVFPCFIYATLYMLGVFGTSRDDGSWVPPTWCSRRMARRLRPPWWAAEMLGAMPELPGWKRVVPHALRPRSWRLASAAVQLASAAVQPQQRQPERRLSAQRKVEHGQNRDLHGQLPRAEQLPVVVREYYREHLQCAKYRLHVRLIEQRRDKECLRLDTSSPRPIIIISPHANRPRKTRPHRNDNDNNEGAPVVLSHPFLAWRQSPLPTIAEVPEKDKDRSYIPGSGPSSPRGPFVAGMVYPDNGAGRKKKRVAFLLPPDSFANLDSTRRRGRA